MKFLIIIPCHNEEENIFHCLKSLEQQNFQDFDIVIVNDGSTDNTPKIIENFVQQSPIKARIKTIHLRTSQHQPGAKVVRTFQKGLESVNWEDYEVICKYDADIIFPQSYLKQIDKLFSANHQLGMASGIVKISKNNNLFPLDNSILLFDDEEDWEFENLSSKNHIRGPIKAYRKDCLLAMKGLRPVLGWDNIDVALCEMYGFTTETNKDLWVKHLRPTAFKYKKQKAEKLGEYFYNLGLNFPLAFIASAKSAWKNRSFSELLITMKVFLQQKHPLALSKEEIQHIRKSRWKKMLGKI